MPKKADTLFERFWKHVTATNGCWIWNGALDKNGYGKIGSFEGRDIRATHASWLLHRGEIPDGMRLCHQCDNPPCVNPDHLFLGTDAANHDDSAKKGRRSRGERHHKAKLTADDVVLIRLKLSEHIPQRSIAREYGVSQAAISWIAARKNWKHI